MTEFGDDLSKSIPWTQIVGLRIIVDHAFTQGVGVLEAGDSAAPCPTVIRSECDVLGPTSAVRVGEATGRSSP